MTRAICFNCGCEKTGSFDQCAKCSLEPLENDELIHSLALTDHHLTSQQLNQYSKSIKNGQAVRLDEQTYESLLRVVSAPQFRVMMNLDARSRAKHSAFNSVGRPERDRECFIIRDKARLIAVPSEIIRCTTSMMAKFWSIDLLDNLPAALSAAIVDRYFKAACFEDGLLAAVAYGRPLSAEKIATEIMPDIIASLRHMPSFITAIRQIDRRRFPRSYRHALDYAEDLLVYEIPNAEDRTGFSRKLARLFATKNKFVVPGVYPMVREQLR